MEFNLADLYEIVADAVPDRLALVAGDRRLTYAQLDERANRFAHHLLEHGVEPGDKVAIYSWDRAEWVEAMLGTYKARAVPINVNYRYRAAADHHRRPAARRDPRHQGRADRHLRHRQDQPALDARRRRGRCS